MDDAAVNDPVQLKKNLAEYREQLQEVEELLLGDPNNAEYKEIYSGLEEVIHLTNELLEAASEDTTAKGPGQLSQAGSAKQIVAAITEAPEVKVPSVLPPQIKAQIRTAQQRAALAGHAPAEWAIGSQIQAKFSGDGTWYDATVTGISASGKFIVTYSAYQTQEEVGIDDVRNIEEQYQTTPSESEYKGVSAPRLNTVRDTSVQSLDEPPTWMQIKASDDEKTKQRKKKLLKSFKSKQRFQKMDTEQKKKADNWKSFLSSKISKKKIKNRSVL